MSIFTNFTFYTPLIFIIFSVHHWKFSICSSLHYFFVAYFQHITRYFSLFDPLFSLLHAFLFYQHSSKNFWSASAFPKTTPLMEKGQVIHLLYYPTSFCACPYRFINTLRFCATWIRSSFRKLRRYVCVIWIFSCPNSLEIVYTSVPIFTCCCAKKWRQVWGLTRTPVIPFPCRFTICSTASTVSCLPWNERKQ